jgi:chemotaxis protein MotB
LKGRSFQAAGHTDNKSIKTKRFPSNWELSGARGIGVTKLLIEYGLPADRISAAAYADTQPVASNDTKEGRAQNRRIEIALQPNLDELPDLSSIDDQD